MHSRSAVAVQCPCLCSVQHLHKQHSVCRHAQQKEYELLGGAHSGTEGAGDSVDGGGDRGIRRCPSKFFVPGLDTTGGALFCHP